MPFSFAHRRPPRQKPVPRRERRHWWPWLLVLGWLLGGGPGQLCRGQTNPPDMLTRVVQFNALPANHNWDTTTFRLRGVLTLVDTNRNLIVLQDATGPLAMHLDSLTNAPEAGQTVVLEGAGVAPYIASFPDYPYHPSGWDIRTNFEAPTDWGVYYLTRMRGWLHPPVTGDYTFWVASDNSSELSLSPDADPRHLKKIAAIPRFGWVSPHDWNRYPSQRSETVRLQAGQAYFVQALQEQTTRGDNLAVAWQGPGLAQAVMDGSYLTPWTKSGGQILPAATNGVLREYWTNYSAGDLAILTVPFESALSAERATLSGCGAGGGMPEPAAVGLTQPLAAGSNFCWCRVEGVVKFVGINGDSARIELSDGQVQISAQVAQVQPALARRLRNATVRVEGVCEGSHDVNGRLMPGMLWSPSDKYISVIEATGTNLVAALTAPALKPGPASADAAIDGFYVTHGVVTFNDRVLGRDYLFVQEGDAAIAVSLKDRSFKNQFPIGQDVELGGGLHPGRYVPMLNPMAVVEAGWQALPDPILQPVELPLPGSRDGRWMELEGVARAMDTNGMLSFKGRDGSIALWMGQTPANKLSHYVNAKLRVRGVLTLTALEEPLLLIPSRDFVDVEETAPAEPFALPATAMGELHPETADPALVHRVKVRGEVVYQDGQSLFLQDASGGVRVAFQNSAAVELGETVEAVGFPDQDGPNHVLTGPLLRLLGHLREVQPKPLDLGETLSEQRNLLVSVAATLLSQKVVGTRQQLELQEQQRVFTATLLDRHSALPRIVPGSRVRVTGVCDEGTLVIPAAGKAAQEKVAVGSLNILLRSPADVILLRGPPWWTMKRTVGLVGALLAVLVVALLWVFLLRRRLEWQQAARLAFSRHMLQGQENERQRIAVNLHDSLGQNLLVIKNQARLAMQPAADEAARQERLGKISEMTSQAIEEVRQITHGLRPYQLDRLGLTQAILAVVTRTSENSSILFASYADNMDGIFDKEAEIHLYRIVQELLNNILKHSAATEAAVVIKTLPGAVSLSVRDNGRGFDAGARESSPDAGYGISGIQERVRILGGRLELDTAPGQGVNLTIEIPRPIAPP